MIIIYYAGHMVVLYVGVIKGGPFHKNHAKRIVGLGYYCWHVLLT